MFSVGGASSYIRDYRGSNQDFERQRGKNETDRGENTEKGWGKYKIG